VIARIGRFVAARVSRRLFVLFLLSAFLPLAAIALLSLTQVRTLLLQQGEQRLAATAKTYGMSVFERLLIAGDIAVAAAFNPQGPLPPDALATRAFSALSVVTGEKVAAMIGPPLAPALSEEVRARLASGKSALVVRGAAAAPQVLLATALPPPSASVVIGEVRPEYLWGPADEMPAATEFCVFEEGSRLLLHCSERMDPGALQVGGAPLSSTLESTTWTTDGETFRARAWPQFMRGAFGTPDWVVVASQPESHQLASALQFRQQYIPVIALAFLLATWFTIRQSRSIVAPVAQLAERARGVARQDFHSRLNLERNDEFGELATAFDQMSSRLGRQFSSLTALSEIDRLILSTQDIAEVIRIVLDRLAEVVRADTITLTLFEHDNPDQARSYSRSPESPGVVVMKRHEVPASERQALEGDSRARWVTVSAADSMPGYLGAVPPAGVSEAYVQPILWRGAVSGALVMGYRVRGELTDDERQQARELADRVAVAVSSAVRDEQLYMQAHYDPLTGLPNRMLLKDRLGREIARSQRESLTFAVLFIDLDHFKNVNDSFGHTTGDAVLREAARRIGRCVRDTDTVARLGGDEFTLMLTGLNHPQEAWLLAESIIASLSREFEIGDQRCFLSASIGIASYPADGSSAEELLKSADTAMYRAKGGGRAQAIYFEERMNRETVARTTLDRDLRKAIERGEMVMHYQPQLDLCTNAIRGAEALIRWNHPVHGLISPTRFIPLAEESGFIEALGEWTLQQSCLQMQAWRREGVELAHISVNVSPRQFRKRGIVDSIQRCVSAAGIPASSIELEITEGLLLDRGEAVEQLLHELSAMGHGIALDDFGTGFSSMAYLQRFPVHTIKIDRVFIERLGRGADSEAIVAGMIAMSHALGKVVIAEGVETAEQLAILRRLLCDEIQGFLLAPALAPAAFSALLREHAKGTAAA
jgi:diguanylate cyclase (GGDEF)-like protein